MKTTRSAALLAKRISCDTTTMVIPHFISRITASTPPMVSGVERAGRLVEQHDARLERQCARDGDALLLAAGSSLG